MKRALLLTAAAAAAVSLAACQRQETAGNVAEGDMATDLTAPVNAAQDAMGAAVGATSAATMAGRDTGAFVENASQSNMYEIQAASIAQQKARSPEVKAFAKTLTTDHTALQNEMRPVITAAGRTPAAELDERRKGYLDNLRAASAENFDKTYIDQQVSAHEEALTMMQGYAENGDDAGLKAVAAKAAPTLETHLDRAKTLQASMAGVGGAAGNAAP